MSRAGLHNMTEVQFLTGDCREVLRTIPRNSIHCVCTSPPYWGLRSYGTAPQIWPHEALPGFYDPLCHPDRHEWAPVARHGQRGRRGGQAAGIGIRSAEGRRQKQAAREARAGRFCTLCRAWEGDLGQEPTPDLFVQHLCDCFDAVQGVLRTDGTLWVVIGDSFYSGDIRLGDLKNKDLIGVPWLFWLAMRARGWHTRMAHIWAKTNAMPESVRDRATMSHEYIFQFTKGGTTSRTVQFTNLPEERLVIGEDLRAKPGDIATVPGLAVKLATAIFQAAKLDQRDSLPPLDSQVWKKELGGGDSDFVLGLPAIHRPAALAARLIQGEASAKEFLRELARLDLDLRDCQRLLIGGGAFTVALPPGVTTDGNTAIAVEHAGKVCKFDIERHTVTFVQPSGRTSYYYDPAAVLEPFADERMGRDGSKLQRQRNRGGRADGFTKPNGIDPSAHGGRRQRSVWNIHLANTKNGHFAVYPRELAERCIKASTSEKGVCSGCGAPWRRTGTPGAWEAGCACEGTTRVPATILDPFAGSGTTGEAALVLGRTAILIDLSPAYRETQEERCDPIKVRARRTGQLALFEEDDDD